MRTTNARRIVGAAGTLLLLGTVTACGGGTGSSGSCAGPGVEFGTQTLTPGESTTIHGEHFVSGCIDTSPALAPFGPEESYESVDLALGVDGQMFELGTFEPVDGEIAATVLIPDDLPSGSADAYYLPPPTATDSDVTATPEDTTSTDLDSARADGWILMNIDIPVAEN